MKAYADEIHQTQPAHPTRNDTVTEQEAHWDYNTPDGILARDQFITCLMTGLRKAALNPINYDKLLRIVQDISEKPSHFLQHLKQAFLQYTNLDPEASEGRQLLMALGPGLSKPLHATQAVSKMPGRGPLVSGLSLCPT